MVSRKRKFSRWWSRVGAGLRLSLLLLTSVLFLFLIYIRRPGDDAGYLGSNLEFFVLVNLNVIILGILAFLIGRNVIKLIFERRNRILGSKLRMRLVLAFVGLTLIPSVFLFVLASGLLSRAMEGWFGGPVEASVQGAKEVARFQHEITKNSLSRQALRLIHEIERKPLLLGTIPSIEELFVARLPESEIARIEVLSEDKERVFEVHDKERAVEESKEPALDDKALEVAFSGNSVTLTSKNDFGQFIRTYAPLKFQGLPHALIATHRVSPELWKQYALVTESFNQYRQLEYYRVPIRTGYLMTLTMITGLILFGAIWVGFYIAREISVPIQRLAEGTRAVASGDYDFKMKVTRDDEIGYLMRSFNRMTSDLKFSRGQGEQRRLFIETILTNLAVGVIGIDAKRTVTSINSAATEICGFDKNEKIIDSSIESVFSKQDFSQILPLLDAVEGEDDGASPAVVEKEITVSSMGRDAKIVCTVGRIIDAEHQWLGTVLLFDDVTELSKAQHMAAWREVARRIAHEIKNPLTPIQLSAQRLPRLLEGTPVESDVREAAQTIVEHVDSIKRLANEFSNFARMPTVEFVQTEINDLISDVIGLYASKYPKVVLQFVAGKDVPLILADRDQVRRALINVVENALVAMELDKGTKRGRLVVKTLYREKDEIVSIEVTDNGPGIEDKVRVFEPYYTTKTRGTGLGLAIVTTIIADHQGEIRIYDNAPRGTRIVIELPTTPREHTQRRFASV